VSYRPSFRAYNAKQRQNKFSQSVPKICRRRPIEEDVWEAAVILISTTSGLVTPHLHDFAEQQ
jgi:hypothetical protein